MNLSLIERFAVIESSTGARSIKLHRMNLWYDN